MGTITFTREDTSRERVIPFLEEIGDNNHVHRFEEKPILPGVYALHLLRNHITRPLERVTIEFVKHSLYPATLEAELTEEEERANFKFVNEKGEVIYQGFLFYRNGNHTANSEKLKAICSIGGQLLQNAYTKGLLKEDETGIYSYQSMTFSENLDGIGVLEIGDARSIDKRSIDIPTSFKSSSGKDYAKGHAVVKKIPKKVAEKHYKLR